MKHRLRTLVVAAAIVACGGAVAAPLGGPSSGQAAAQHAPFGAAAAQPAIGIGETAKVTLAGHRRHYRGRGHRRYHRPYKRYRHGHRRGYRHYRPYRHGYYRPYRHRRYYRRPVVRTRLGPCRVRTVRYTPRGKVVRIVNRCVPYYRPYGPRFY